MNPGRKKKISEGTALMHKSSSKQPIRNRSEIEHIYPFTLGPEADMNPELHHRIIEMERDYLQLYSILLNNREKYDEMFSNLASQMDERGVSSDKVVELLSKLNYYPPPEEWVIVNGVNFKYLNLTWHYHYWEFCEKND